MPEPVQTSQRSPYRWIWQDIAVASLVALAVAVAVGVVLAEGLESGSGPVVAARAQAPVTDTVRDAPTAFDGSKASGASETLDTAKAPDSSDPVAAPDAPDVDAPDVDVAALVRENRDLDARATTLEQETTDLEGELLRLDLRLVALSTRQREGDAVPGGDAPPDGAGVSADAGSGYVPAPADEAAAADPFLPDATSFDDAPIGPPPLGLDETDPGGERAEVARLTGIPLERLAVAEVPAGGPAESAGLRPGDLVLSIDGQAVLGPTDVPDTGLADDGHLHEIEIMRDGKRVVIPFTGSPTELALRSEWIDPATLVE